MKQFQISMLIAMSSSFHLAAVMHCKAENMKLPEVFMREIETIKQDQPSENNIDKGIQALVDSASKLKKEDAIRLYLMAATEITRTLYNSHAEKLPGYTDIIPPELGVPYKNWVDPEKIQDPVKRDKYKKAWEKNKEVKRIIIMQTNAYSYFGSIAWHIAFTLRTDNWETKQAVLDESVRLKLPRAFQSDLERVFQYKLPMQPPESGKSASEGSKKEPEKSPPQKTGE